MGGSKRESRGKEKVGRGGKRERQIQERGSLPRKTQKRDIGMEGGKGEKRKRDQASRRKTIMYRALSFTCMFFLLYARNIYLYQEG